MTDSKQTYDELWAGGWTRAARAPGPSYRTRRRHFLRALARVYRPGKSILDVGCGHGSLLRDVRRRFPDAGPLWGTDVSSAALELAREVFPDGRYFQADPQSETLEVEEPFDLVLSSDVLEHVDEFEAVIAQMESALKPGGAMVISAPHAMKYWGPCDEAVHHVRRFEQEDLEAALRRRGLLVERSFTWGAGVFRLYYALILNRRSQKSVWTQQEQLRSARKSLKSRLTALAQGIFYRLFYLDDLLIPAGNGRMLFIIARKPQS
jgi:trans-aconitate methyltransferase